VFFFLLAAALGFGRLSGHHAHIAGQSAAPLASGASQSHEHHFAQQTRAHRTIHRFAGNRVRPRRHVEDTVVVQPGPAPAFVLTEQPVRAPTREVAAAPTPEKRPPQPRPAFVPLPINASTVSAEHKAYLSLTVNGMDQGEILALVHGGDVWIPLAELARAGIRGVSPPTRTIEGQPYVSLSSLAPGISSTFNDRALSLKLIAQSQDFASTSLNMGGNAPTGMIYGKNTSAFLNYALDWQNFNQVVEFSELGVSSHGNLYYSGFSFGPGGKFVRGLTSATFDNPAHLTRWVLGDTFAEGGVLGGGTFLAGIGVSRNFSLNPYYVRYPGVGLSGQALTPSTAEVYVNGHLVGTRALAPGSFDITNIPVVAGGGTAQVIVRDAFGRTQTLSSAYYYATNVLQKGVSEFSYNLGVQRNNVATSSGDYGHVVFVGFDRVGITDWFTAGARLDAGPGLYSGGPNAALRLGRGQLGLNAAFSHSPGFGGTAAEADYTYQNHLLSYGGTIARMSPYYTTVSLASTADRATSLASAFAGFEIGSRSSVTLDYTASHWRDSGPQQNLALIGSVRLSDKIDVVAAAQHVHASTSANQFTVSLNYQIGRNTIGAVSQQGGSVGSGSAVSVQQSLPLGSGVGYRFERGNGSQIQNDDLVQVQTSYGLYQASYLQSPGFSQKDLLVSGGLVDAGDGVMFSRAVGDGYAVIDLPGVRGVRGYFNNQEIGRTDGRGRLLIPNLIAYYGNRVEISDQDVPLEYSVDATEETVATTYRGGALVRFPVKREIAVTGKMVVANSHKDSVPSFGQLRVTIGGQAVISELNQRGEFYLENVLPGRYPGIVDYADGSCAFELIVPHEHDMVTQVGSVRCAPPQVSRNTP
jgi:outer membrane usher protein